MQNIKNNPTLTLSALKDKISTPNNTIIVSPSFECVARELFQHFMRNVIKIKEFGKELTVEQAIEKHLFSFIEEHHFNFKIIVEPKIKKYEWILITENEIYYSNGDNTN